jgi:hypothetical protein
MTDIEAFLADVRRPEWLDRDDAVTVEIWCLGQCVASVRKDLSKNGMRERHEDHV